VWVAYSEVCPGEGQPRALRLSLTHMFIYLTKALSILSHVLPGMVEYAAHTSTCRSRLSLSGIPWAYHGQSGHHSENGKVLQGLFKVFQGLYRGHSTKVAMRLAASRSTLRYRQYLWYK